MPEPYILKTTMFLVVQLIN